MQVIRRVMSPGVVDSVEQDQRKNDAEKAAHDCEADRCAVPEAETGTYDRARDPAGQDDSDQSEQAKGGVLALLLDRVDDFGRSGLFNHGNLLGPKVRTGHVVLKNQEIEALA